MKLTSRIIGLVMLVTASVATTASAQCLGLKGVSAPIICADPSLRAQEARVQSLTAGLQNADSRNMPGLRTNDGWREQHEQCHDANCARYSYDYRISRLEELTDIARQSAWEPPASDTQSAAGLQKFEEPGSLAAPVPAIGASPIAPSEPVSPDWATEQPAPSPTAIGAASAVGDGGDQSVQNLPANARTEPDGGNASVLLFAVLGLAGVILYVLPSLVAFLRGHAYRWVILAINVVCGWTLLGWVGSMVWAIWPADKALLDPVVGNVTGVGQRNMGDALGEADLNRSRTREGQAVPGQLSTAQLDQLERLGRLKAQGVLTDDEFARQRAALMG